MGRTHRTTTRCWNHYRVQSHDFPCFVGKATTHLSADLLLSIASSRRSLQWSSAGVTEAKNSKNNQYVDYQYLDVPVFTDRYWILRAFETKQMQPTGQRKFFYWKTFRTNIPSFKKSPNENPYALEPLINVGAWILKTDDKGLLQSYIFVLSGGSVLWHCSPSLPKIFFQTTSRHFD